MVESLGSFANPTQAPAPDESRKQELFQKWDQFLQRPDITAAALQFGVHMLQPMAPGQTFAGHLGQSIGQGAAAAGRVQETQRQQQAQAQEFELEGRRVGAAESQAATSARRADIASEGLDIERDRLDFQRQDAADNLKLAREKLALLQAQAKDEQTRSYLGLASERQLAVLDAVTAYNEAGADAAFFAPEGSEAANFQPIKISPDMYNDANMLKMAEGLKRFEETGERPATAQEIETERFKNATADEVEDMLFGVHQMPDGQTRELTPEERGQYIVQYTERGGNPGALKEALSRRQPAKEAQGQATGPQGQAATGTETELSKAAQSAVAASKAASQTQVDIYTPLGDPATAMQRRKNKEDELADQNKAVGEAVKQFKNTLPETLDEVSKEAFDIIRGTPVLIEALKDKYGDDALNNLYQKYHPKGATPTIE